MFRIDRRIKKSGEMRLSRIVSDCFGLFRITPRPHFWKQVPKASSGQFWSVLVGFWSVLVVSGQFLLVSGQFWLFLVISVYFWSVLVVSGHFWLFLVSSGCFCLRLAQSHSQTHGPQADSHSDEEGVGGGRNHSHEAMKLQAHLCSADPEVLHGMASLKP